MSLQIAILKVLVSHPEGRATIAALNSDLSILDTSGSDWTDRLRRLAARAPGLDIFGHRLILRDSSGWQITPEGRAFLAWLERGAASANVPVAEPPPKGGGEAGDFTALSPSDGGVRAPVHGDLGFRLEEGGVFHRKVVRGSEPWGPALKPAGSC